MLKIIRSLSALLLAGTLSLSAQAAPNYEQLKPMGAVINTPVADCRESQVIRVPVIAWGPDAALLVANGNATHTAPGSILAGKGITVDVYRQDNFQQQVADYLACKTPFLRGTFGMVNQAMEVLSRDPRTAPVVSQQLSWSNGGDNLVVRENIRKPGDLKGKKIAVQIYGPHVDYLFRILGDAGIKPTDVTIVWTKDLSQDTAQSVSPARALREDPSVDAAFVITPDALALTSNGTVGTGAEESVKGAYVLLSTKTANRVIADVYVVRRDYFDAQRNQIEQFANALMQGEEQLRELVAQKGPKLDVAAKVAAKLLLGSEASSAVADFIGLYGDAEVAGFPENVKFFTDSAYPRGFNKLTAEIQQSFMATGLLSKVYPLVAAGWDYKMLVGGLKNTANVELHRFDPTAVQTLVDTRAKQPSEEGVLFQFEVYFGPNQNTFSALQYQAAFDQVINLASTYGGALMTIEGHVDPSEYLRNKKNGATPMVLSRIHQGARNLSQSRANAVKDTIISYSSGKGITLDPTQFGVSGLGVSQPNVPGCTFDQQGDIMLNCAPHNEQEWNATRRVVFKIVRVEAEAAVFKPL